MARNFSDSLNSAFAIHDNATTPQLEDLAQSVSQKKAAVDSQTSELQALEARIKEMDRRLEQRNSRTSSPAGRRGQDVGGVLHRRPLAGDTFGNGNAGGGMSAPGVAGSFHNSNSSGQRGALERKPVIGMSSPLADRAANSSSEQGYADRTVKMRGGVENISASTKSDWAHGGDGETVNDERG